MATKMMSAAPSARATDSYTDLVESRAKLVRDLELAESAAAEEKAAADADLADVLAEFESMAHRQMERRVNLARERVAQASIAELTAGAASRRALLDGVPESVAEKITRLRLDLVGEMDRVMSSPDRADPVHNTEAKLRVAEITTVLRAIQELHLVADPIAAIKQIKKALSRGGN